MSSPALSFKWAIYCHDRHGSYSWPTVLSLILPFWYLFHSQNLMLQRTFFATLVTSYVMLATLAALAVDPVVLISMKPIWSILAPESSLGRGKLCDMAIWIWDLRSEITCIFPSPPFTTGFSVKCEKEWFSKLHIKNIKDMSLNNYRLISSRILWSLSGSAALPK